MKLTPTLRTTIITITSFILVITAVNAWTGPSTTPPDPNVSAPLTISATSQSKVGGIDVGWLSSVGAVKVGNTTTACTADIAGSLRWNTGVMEYCNGTVWGPFVSSSSGGGSSPYCAYTGQSHTVNLAINHYINISGSCTVSVDATGYQTFSFSASGAGGSCSRTGNNQDSHPACTYTGFDSGGTGYGVEMSGSFNRDTGVLTCRLTEVGGSSTADSYTFTKDLSKCSTGGSGGDNFGNHTATQNINMGGSQVTNIGTPTNASDAATKAYVDAKIAEITGATAPASPASCPAVNNGCYGYCTLPAAPHGTKQNVMVDITMYYNTCVDGTWING